MKAHLAVFSLLALSTTATLAAPAPPSPAPPPAPDGSLAAALRQAASPEEGGVALTVKAEAVTLPDGGTAPSPGAPADQVGAAFGRLVRRSGRVVALAPPTMVILNTRPSVPNPYQDLPPEAAMQLLFAGLDSAQWSLLTSVRGLGLDDLRGEDQRTFFRDLFPGDMLRVISTADTNDLAKTGPPTTRELNAATLSQSRLRLSQRASLLLPDAAGGNYSGGPPMEGGYSLVFGGYSPVRASGFEAGVQVIATVANAPKPGNLDFQDSRLSAMIPLDQIRTIRELIDRVDKATHLELFADRRYEPLSIEIAGREAAIPARDLLQALALCVTGTFRRVGPAYVLTDDLVGLGTRQEILEQYKETVSTARNILLKPSHDALKTIVPRLNQLPFTPGGLRIGPEQDKYVYNPPNTFSNALARLRLPFTALTPDQQNAALSAIEFFKHHNAELANQRSYQAHPFPLPAPTLAGNLDLETTLTVQLLVPGLDGPVNLNDEVRPDLNLAPMQGVIRTKYELPDAPAESVRKSLDRFPRRACLVAPQSLDELDRIVAAMPAAHLNELWLLVPGPEVGGGKSGSPLARAMVDEALERAKAMPAPGVRVLPALDLLRCTPAAAGAALDYTILGKTADAAARGQDASAAHPGFPHPTPAAAWAGVSPFSPTVESSLRSLLHDVIRPGIAGLVWDAVSLPGYALPEPHLVRSPAGELGYHADGRLAFLRWAHVDPVDIDMEPFPEERVATTPPLFRDSALNQQLQDQWDQFRQGADLALMQRLFWTAQGLGAAFPIAAPEKDSTGTTIPFASTPGSSDYNTGPASPRLPILMRAPGLYTWYAEWDDLRRFPLIDMDHADTSAHIADSANSQTRHALWGILPWSMATRSALGYHLADAAAGRGFDGVVFDFRPLLASGSHPALSSLAYLEQLGKTLSDGS